MTFLQPDQLADLIQTALRSTATHATTAPIVVQAAQAAPVIVPSVQSVAGLSLSDWWAIPTFTVGLATLIVTGLQFRRTFVRSVRVRHVFTSEVADFRTGPNTLDPELVVDVLSCGAAITDLKARIELFRPAEFDSTGEEMDRPFARTNIELDPKGDTKSVGIGQAVRFAIRKSELFPPTRSHSEEMFRQNVDTVDRIPSRCISLVITCSGGRKELKRLRSNRVNIAVYHFFGRLGKTPKARFPLKARLQGRLFEFTHSPRGTRLRRWIELRRPGTFDLMYSRLDRYLSEFDHEKPS